jgi:hypothetical protein
MLSYHRRIVAGAKFTEPPDTWCAHAPTSGALPFRHLRIALSPPPEFADQPHPG